MKVGSVGSVGSAPSVSQASPAQSTVKSGGGSAPSAESGAPSSAGSHPWFEASGKNQISTSDFVTLTQKTQSGEKCTMKDAKDMLKAIVALQILQKKVEATQEILENIFNPKK